MIGPSFFLEQFLGLVMGEIWDCSKEKIITAYKNYKNATEENKSFETRMYTAIVDAFCYYANVKPHNAHPDIMDFIYTTAEVYFNESQRKQDDTPATLLDALHSLDSKFGDTTLFKNYKNKEKKDDAKIETVANYLQKYIVKDDKFKDEYINEVLTRLLRMGKRIEKMQLAQQLFPEQIIAAVKESEQRINANTNTTMTKESDRVISIVLDKIDSLEIERFSEPYTGQEIQHEFEKPKFKDEKTEYIEKWNERLFLHRKPEDKYLTLENTFIMPAYSSNVSSEHPKYTEYLELINLLNLYDKIEGIEQNLFQEFDDLEESLNQFITSGRSMLILGKPGMGKSTITCYLANKYKDNSQVLILKFKNLNLKGTIEQQSNNRSILLDSIINYLHCTKENLKNKILILDGYDEIDSYFFNIDLFSDFFLSIREIKNFRLLITSRENYIMKGIQYFEKVIYLLPFNKEKINKFAIKITGNIKPITIFHNNEVFGIPVILYMALATDVDLSQSISSIGVYNKIFSINGGIFDRFYSQSNDSYEIGTHTISYVKNTFYNILCNTAFYMFENFSDNSIPQNAYEKIIEDERTKAKELLARSSELNSPLWYDFPIENLYEKSDSISFIHKSFYEYFAAEYFFAVIYSISKDIVKRNLYDNENKEECNKIISGLSNLFSQNAFSAEIVEYLQYKINTNFCNDEIEILRKFYIYIFKRMLARGMTYNLSQSIKHSTLQTECVIFANMLDFIHLWIKYDLYQYIKFEKIEMDQISIYLKLWSLVNLPCTRGVFKVIDPSSSTRLNLSHFNLDGINLKYITLINIDFKNTSLNNSDLDYITIIDSNFKYAEFIGSSLIGANFSGSFFRETNFLNANIVADFMSCHQTALISCL